MGFEIINPVRNMQLSKTLIWCPQFPSTWSVLWLSEPLQIRNGPHFQDLSFVFCFSQLSSNYGSMPGSWYFRAVEMYLRSQNWKQLRQPVSTWLPGTAWEFPVHIDDPLSKTGATSTLTFISSYLKITAEECGLMWVPGGLSLVDTQSWLCPPACLEPLDIFLKSHYRL